MKLAVAVLLRSAWSVEVPPLDEAYFAEALPLVQAPNLPCRVPNNTDALVFRGASPAQKQKAREALSVAGVLAAGAARAREEHRTYESRLVDYALGDCFKQLRKCGNHSRWRRDTLAVEYEQRANGTVYDYELPHG